jgi:hypothetical protein
MSNETVTYSLEPLKRSPTIELKHLYHKDRVC